MRGDDYPTRVIASLTHAGMLAAALRFDCLACGSANSLSADLIGQSLKCQLCREESALATYLAVRKKLNWLLAVPPHLPIEQLRETYPVMGSLSVLQGFQPDLEVPHALLSTRLRSETIDCEIDFIAILELGGLPTVIICEAKATQGEVDDNDLANLVKVQDAIRAVSIECYVLIASLAESFTDGEVNRLRRMSERGLRPVAMIPGADKVPVVPIVLVRADLSAHSFDRGHPRRGVDGIPTIGALAVATCRKNLGLAGWDARDYSLGWSSPPHVSVDG